MPFTRTLRAAALRFREPGAGRLRKLLLFTGLLIAAAASLSSLRLRPTLLAAQAGSPSPAGPAPLETYHKGRINFATGLYVRTDQDLVVQGDLPIVVQRTYRTEDRVSRAFGVGASHNGEWYLRSDSAGLEWVELVLEDGSRVRYDRTSAGSSFENAEFVHLSTPTRFYRSRIWWTGSAWALRWTDGGSATFRACGSTGTDLCSIVQMKSPDGRTIDYVRDRAQLLRAIRSGTVEVLFDYDARQRVVRIHEAEGQDVKYEYDTGGRLSRVTESGGVVRQYTYDTRGAMLTVDEPRWHLENTYDAGGRCIHQVTRWPDGGTDEISVAYKLREGAIVEVVSSWRDGPKTVYHFDEDRTLESEERDPDGPAPVVIDYTRNPVSRQATGVTIRCYDADRHLVRDFESRYPGEDLLNAMVTKACGR